MKRENLKHLREENRLTQAQMAKKLEISLSHYKNIELGVYDPSLKVAGRLHDLFHVNDIWELLKKC